MPTINVESGSDLQLQEIADVLAKARKVVVITGAGISTNCGIPDFRSENGLYALIQAQYDAAATAKSAQVEEQGTHDETDDRPTKRRKFNKPNPIPRTMQLRSSRSFCGASTIDFKEISPAAPQLTLRRTRSSSNIESKLSIPNAASDVPEELSTASSQASNVSTTSSSNSTRFSLPNLTPSSSQSSMTPSTTRGSLPNLKGKDLFDSLVWSDPLTTSIFYTFVTSLREKIRRDVTETTETHKFIKALRDAGRLVRNYTQNIDMLEEREGLCTELEMGTGDRSRFSQKVYKPSEPGALPGAAGGGGERGSFSSGVESVYLHGSLGALRCGLCARLSNWDEDGRTETTFAGDAPDCPWCTANSSKREGRGRRSLAIGRLRPDIVLYGEEHPAAHLISPLITHDLSLGPDVLLILGTSLRVHGLKVMVREFSKAVRGRGGKVIFVNQTKPPDSIWGDIIDYHIQWDCDQWVENLKQRRSDVWLPIGAPGEGKTKEEKPKTVAKNPVAMRQDTSSGAYLTMKILDFVGRLSGRLPCGKDCIVVSQETTSTLVCEGSNKRKRNTLPRPKAVREEKENGAYLVWKIGHDLKRLTGGLTLAADSLPKIALQEVSANILSRGQRGGKKAATRAQTVLPTPPNSDQDVTPPLSPRALRTKTLCGISAMLSSPTRGPIRVEDSGRLGNTIRVWRDDD